MGPTVTSSARLPERRGWRTHNLSRWVPGAFSFRPPGRGDASLLPLALAARALGCPLRALLRALVRLGLDLVDRAGGPII